jgi:hypothetical protein
VPSLDGGFRSAFKDDCAKNGGLRLQEINKNIKGKYLRYWKYHLSFDDDKIFTDIV